MNDSELFAALSDAMRRRDIPKFTSLLSEHPSLDTTKTGVLNTLLHHAVTLTVDEAIKPLIGAGADVNSVDSTGHTPLLTALFWCRFRTATILIEAGANVNLADKLGYTPLHLALERDSSDTVLLLIKAGANVNAPNKQGMTPLHLASANGSSSTVGVLIDAGASIRAVDTICRTPLLVAADRGHRDVIKVLLAAGADVKADDSRRCTALHWAAANGQCDVAETLIKAGADVGAIRNDIYTPLHDAACHGDCDMVKLLLKAGARVGAIGRGDLTPLHVAASCGHADVARVLVDAGADVRAVDNGWCQVGNVAMHSGRDDGCALFFPFGGILDLSDDQPKSPLAHVLNVSRLGTTPTSIREMFTLLTAAGATVDGATAKISPIVPSDVIRAIVPKDTSFWLAANNDAPKLAAELAGGLDPNTDTFNGMTLLHWACAGDAPECVQLLLEAGANQYMGLVSTELDSEDEYEEFLDLSPTPVFYCMHESSVCLENMIRYGVDVNYPYGNNMYPMVPLHFALAANSPACATALVGAEAWVTGNQHFADDFAVCSPMEAALSMNPRPYESLRALLAVAGDEILAPKFYLSETPVLVAISRSTVEAVRICVEAGASLKGWGRDPLDHANDLLSRHRTSAEIARLTAIIDYLKSLPCYNKEAKSGIV